MLMPVYASFVLVTTRSILGYEETTDRSRRRLRSLSLSLLLLALFITLITVAHGTLLIVNFIGTLVVQQQNHLFPGELN